MPISSPAIPSGNRAPPGSPRPRAISPSFARLLTVTPPQALRVAYHPACSLQNSLKLNGVGEALLEAAGFIVTPFAESHLCCGSAGTYSILQPELSGQLRARKLGNIAAAEPDVLVSGNIGCLQHLAAGEGLDQPILHIAELLDWAEGGPKPSNLELPGRAALSSAHAPRACPLTASSVRHGLCRDAACQGAIVSPAPQKVTSEEQLFAQLKQCGSAEDAHPIEEKLQAMFRASNSPSVDLLMTRALTAQGAGDNKTARQLVEAVTKIAPNYAEGWHVRATMEQGAGDDTAALVSLQKAVLLNPRQFTALGELGDMLQDYGDKAGALKLYRRALDLDPQLDGAAQKVRELTQSVEGRDI